MVLPPARTPPARTFDHTARSNPLASIPPCSKKERSSIATNAFTSARGFLQTNPVAINWAAPHQGCAVDGLNNNSCIATSGRRKVFKVRHIQRQIGNQENAYNRTPNADHSRSIGQPSGQTALFWFERRCVFFGHEILICTNLTPPCREIAAKLRINVPKQQRAKD